MILTLAFRNLFHDRVRLAVTLVGILFSIVLVAVQLGLYLGSSNMITENIDRAKADLWITVYGAKSFEDGGMLLTSRERHHIVGRRLAGLIAADLQPGMLQDGHLHGGGALHDQVHLRNAARLVRFHLADTDYRRVESCQTGETTYGVSRLFSEDRGLLSAQTCT